MYLGIDIGSITIKYALVNKQGKVVEQKYLRIKGDLLNATKKILNSVGAKKVSAIAVTGSARAFIGSLIEADLIIDEITAHRTAINKMYPKVKTIFEIGGQDSKLIYFSGNSINFEMNNVCAAGTGSFLDQQAARLGVSIEEFCKIGLTSKEYHKIASKCTVFAETDIIHAQQSGIPLNRVIRGIHRGLIDNYFMQLCRGKKLEGDFLFEGGTSENPLLVQEIQNKFLESGLIKSPRNFIVPKPYNTIIGAWGAALLCIKRGIDNPRDVPKINKFEVLENKNCFECNNKCGAEVMKVKINKKILTFGKRCQ
ncbi:BadF/BadG/BcrA/BcrD ATPase family protein [uncultured archaeon]|nr:BadF/BadG/BcrA/BcrD ATPase family protein [uncultured archaeon]